MFTCRTSNVSKTAESWEDLWARRAALWKSVKVLGWERWVERQAVALDRKQRRSEAAANDSRASRSCRRCQPCLRY